MDNNESENLLKVDLDLMDLSEVGRESMLLKSSSETGENSTSKGLCVKEYEEKMDDLKKENFNLKLRLYFLEEKNGVFPEGTEALHKQIINLKIENENLSRDLKERQDLLLHASKALEMVEEEKKIDNDNAEKLLLELNKKIESLEEEKYVLQQALQDANKSQLGNDTGYADFFGAVDAKDIETQRKILELSQMSENLQQQLISSAHELERCKKDKDEYEDINAKLKYECDELRDKLANAESKTNEIQRKFKMFQEMFDERGQDLQFLQDQNDRLFRTNKRLNEKLEELEYSQFELSVRFQDFQDNSEFIKKLQEELAVFKEKWANSECDLIDMRAKYEDSETERKKTISLLKKAVEKTADAEQKVSELEEMIREKSCMAGGLEKGDAKRAADDEIKALQEELSETKKKLELMTSAELIEKNKEIEHLTSMINNIKVGRPSSVPELPRFSFDYIFDSFNDLKFQQAMEIKKQSQQKITELMNELIRLTNSKTQRHVEKLKQEMNVVIEKQQFTDSAMNQCFELCSYTLDHLHELAVFLSNLLQQKTIRDSLSEQSLMNIQSVIDQSLNISQRHSIDTRLSSLPNISNLDILVQTARASIANIRELQQCVPKIDKSMNVAMKCENCDQMKAKFDEITEEYEQLKRVNELLEDEIHDAKQIIAGRDEKISKLMNETEESKHLEDELSILLDDYKSTIQKLQIEKIELQTELNQNNEKFNELHLREKSLQDRLNKITEDLSVNWISKEQYDLALDKLREEIVNGEAEIAAIRMELDEVRSIASNTAQLMSDDKENIVKLSNSVNVSNIQANDNKIHANTRRTIEISDDRKLLLMATETTTTTTSTTVCNMCPKYQNQIRELKKYLGRAVENIKKQSEQKAIVDRHIQNQLVRTEGFLEQARYNMEKIVKNKENRDE